MDLKNYLHIIKRYYFIILLFVFCTTITTTVIVFLVPPEYEASTTLMVNQASSDTINLNDLMASERLAKTYAEIITKRSILDQIINELDLDVEYDDFLKKVDVQLIRDTQLISVTVKDRNPNKAAEITDAIAQKISEEVIVLQGDRENYNTIAIVEQAVPSTKPDSPQKELAIGLSFLLSLLGVTGILLLREYLDDSFKDEFDINEFLSKSR